MAIHLGLDKLYHDDKNDRQLYEKGKLREDKLRAKDEARLSEAKELLAKKAVDLDEIWNCHYLCLLFMHSWSKDSEDYKRAHEFAKKAVSLGSNVTKWLYAASLDRWLVSQGKLQKFGTQYNIKNGEIAPYDTQTNDREREEYGVPNLSKLLKR